ncbi:hypothetical protein K3725_05875 [Leisingera sp. S132]|nr:hypothetical protein [Leisingera sp. S132]UWQ80531.1 hypothetical protein K3725_05875 [Leisingera sp. S132]
MFLPFAHEAERAIPHQPALLQFAVDLRIPGTDFIEEAAQALLSVLLFYQ